MTEKKQQTSHLCIHRRLFSKNKIALSFNFGVCPQVFGLLSVIVSVSIREGNKDSLGCFLYPNGMLLVSPGKWQESTLVCSGISCAFGSQSAWSSTERCEVGSTSCYLALEAAGWDLPLQHGAGGPCKQMGFLGKEFSAVAGKVLIYWKTWDS